MTTDIKNNLIGELVMYKSDIIIFGVIIGFDNFSKRYIINWSDLSGPTRHKIEDTEFFYGIAQRAIKKL